AIVAASGPDDKLLRNVLLLRLNALKATPQSQDSSALNVIIFNQALAHIDVREWNYALESLRTFQDQAAYAPELQAAVYYYQAICLEQLNDRAGALDYFDRAMKERNKQLSSTLFFDFQTLSEWRRSRLR